MSTKYSVTIMRHREDEDPEELTDRWITADQAIDLMMQVNEMDDSSEEEESEPEEEEEVDDEPEEPKPKRGGGSYGSWDKERAKVLIQQGAKAGDIADEVGTSIGNIYQLKSDMKKAGELAGRRVATSVEVDTPKSQDRQPGHTEEDHEKKMQALFKRLPETEKELVRQYKEGIQRSELLMMYPSITTMRVDDLINAYGNIEI